MKNLKEFIIEAENDSGNRNTSHKIHNISNFSNPLYTLLNGAFDGSLNFSITINGKPISNRKVLYDCIPAIIEDHVYNVLKTFFPSIKKNDYRNKIFDFKVDNAEFFGEMKNVKVQVQPNQIEENIPYNKSDNENIYFEVKAFYNGNTDNINLSEPQRTPNPNVYFIFVDYNLDNNVYTYYIANSWTLAGSQNAKIGKHPKSTLFTQL